jgi:DNA polymerase III epsilon subunit-like protein
MIPIFLDTETTDNTPEARLIQLCFTIGRDGVPYTGYFKPPIRISHHAMAVHHITDKKVENENSFLESKCAKFLQETLKDNCLIAHNAKFDIQVLKNEGIEVPFYVCTLQVARHLIEAESHQLQYLRYFLELDIDGGAHDAYDDVAVLKKLYDFLFDKIFIELMAKPENAGVVTEAKILQKMHELTMQPVLLKIFKFGKYMGKTFEEVAKFDAQYLQWLLASETKKNKLERNVDLIHTLKNYLKF